MQQILSTWGQKLAKTWLVLALTCLLSLGGIFLTTSQPSYAETLTSQDKIDRAYTFRDGAGMQEEIRQKSYEEEIEAGTGAKTVEKLYEENLKEYTESQPQEGVVEKAKEAVKKITDK